MRIVDGRQFDIDFISFERNFGSSGETPVTIFDFDGVLSSPDEDLAYKLPEQVNERSALEAIAPSYGIDTSLYAGDMAYLRHLVLQAIMLDQGETPAPGPAINLAQKLSLARWPIFILTARSGAAAIERVFQFVREYQLLPQEIFFVGRVAKGRQLSLLRKKISSDRKIIYFEDSIRHARNSYSQRMSGFETIHVDWSGLESDSAQSLVDRLLFKARALTETLHAA